MEGGLDGFLEHYLRQLSDTTDDVVQLAAEVLYVHLWINAKSITGSTKRAAINRVLALRAVPTPMPEPLAVALDMGLVRTGASFHQYRWTYLRTMVDTAIRIQRMSARQREQLLGDPWHFRDWLLTSSNGLAQRHALLHLLYPDTSEAIISVADKQLILKRLTDRLASRSGNDDRDLFELRRAMAPEFGPRYAYYRPPVVELWR